MNEERVRLAIVHSAETNVRVNRDPTLTEVDDPLEPEIAFEKGQQVLLISPKKGGGFLVNGNQVKVADISGDEVSLAIDMSSADDPQPGKPARGTQFTEAPAFGASFCREPKTGEDSLLVIQRSAPAISHDVFSEWIARQINQYFDAHPQESTQNLAAQVGVSPATISRWRTRQTNIAKSHLQNLLGALGIQLDDLARELGVSSIKPPDVKTRGPSRLARRASAVC